MNIKVSEIFKRFQSEGIITEIYGSDCSISRFSPVETCQAGDLVFVDRAKFLHHVLDQHPSAVVTTLELKQALQETNNLAILISPNVRLATARLRQYYDDRDLHHTEWPPIHPSAIIHQSVDIPENCTIGPGAVLGANVTLGDSTVIMANSVIESGVSIGQQSTIHPSCVIGYNCQIGADVIIKSGCIIGSEGQGFAQDEQRKHHRIPQTGIVVIEDRVVIGPNCTIDRATYTETRVHSGCIIDALCHLAHNVVLDEDCILVAQTGIAGSSRFGKRVIASGQTGVLDHVSVPDDTVLLHRAGVINSIKKSGIYATTPPQPFKQYLKNIAVFQRLGEVWKRLKVLEKKVDELSR